jgi:predicted phage tail protein
MLEKDLIVGAGGGGKGGKKPKEAKDNLDSTQHVTVVDLISEGEIQGLKDGPRSIFLDNTPLASTAKSGTYSQSGTTVTVTSSGHGLQVGNKVNIDITSGTAADGDYEVATVPSASSFTYTSATSLTTSGNLSLSTYNFQDVQIFTRTGTQAQSYIPVAADVETEVGVGVSVLQATPITRTISATQTNAVRVTITVPQLQRIKDNGNIVGTSVQLQIQVQYSGGGYTTVVDDTITGRTIDTYQRDYVVNLSGAFPVNVRVVRITPDSTSAKLADAFTWASYTQITYAKLRYPNSALVAMRADAQQFSSIPQRSYLVRGIKVKIPNNATVDQTTGRLTYSGIWTGTFGAAQWCSDPAWILWDLLTSTRYGFGDHVKADQLDKWAFLSASQYCSALVPNGFGGQEPRFSCNVNIQSPADAYKLINDMCSVFRAMPFWSAGALTIAQDSPATPAYLFTLANVEEGGFAYSGGSLKARPNVAVVGYFDLNQKTTAYEVVEDAASVSKYGAITTEIEAFACTSRGQAARVGEWLLYSEQYESEAVSFTASIDAGVLVRPGQIIEIADPVRAGSRRGGRISSATTTTVTIDDTTGLPVSSGGTLSVILPTGVVESRSVTGRTSRVFTVSPAFSAAPNANSIWVYESDTVQSSQWRVVGIQEQEDAKYAVTALAYNSSKYDYIERDRPLQTRTVTNLYEIPLPPSNLGFTEGLYQYQNQVRSKVIISWRPVEGVTQYEVYWRVEQGNWQSAIVEGSDYEILDTTPGLFEVEIYSVAALGRRSTAALSGSFTSLGKTAPPSNVTNFTHTIDPSIGTTLNWDPIADFDLSDYEIRRGPGWESAEFLTRVQATSYKLGYLDNGNFTYLIKARDTSGVYSSLAAARSISVAPPGTPTVTSVIANDIVTINWTAVSGSYIPAYYEVRFGASFATGSSLGRFTTTSITVPITWTGARTFWVAGVDSVGKVGTAGSTTVTNSGAPAPTVSHTFGSDSVVLSWGQVNGAVPTKYYEIRRGTTFSTATALSTIQATSFSVKVDWVGSQTFWVAAVDENNVIGTGGSRAVTVAAAAAPTVNSSFVGDQVVLSWNAVKGSLDTSGYQVRRGNDFATATTLTIIQGTTYATKVNWEGSQRFWVAAVDVANNVGEGGPEDAVISAPGQPVITEQVVDNNVLLRWGDVTAALPIVYYELRRGMTWAGADIIGTKQGRFTTVFETQSGTYNYWLAAVDSAGNYGTPGSVMATVNQPPDYQLQLDQNSTFGGTKTNLFTEGGTLTANVNLTETWQTHFTSRGWNTPQDQINAGFPIYGLPSANTGSYEEIFDYGTVLASSKVAVTLTSQAAAGTMTVASTLSVRKLTTDAWTDYAGITEVFATDFRYIKVRYDFTSSGNDDLLLITMLNLKLDVKLKNDAGNGTANAADVGGTQVNFNVSFTDVQSISVTPSGTTARLAVYDFVDAPNPTGFKVLIFDTNGTRVSGGFSWSAKGV